MYCIFYVIILLFLFYCYYFLCVGSLFSDISFFIFSFRFRTSLVLFVFPFINQSFVSLKDAYFLHSFFLSFFVWLKYNRAIFCIYEKKNIYHHFLKFVKVLSHSFPNAVILLFLEGETLIIILQLREQNVCGIHCNGRI